MSIIAALLPSLSARLTELGAQEAVSITASTWSTSTGGHTTTCARAVTPANARPMPLHQLAQDPCSCRDRSTLSSLSTGTSEVEFAVFEVCLAQLEDASSRLDVFSTPATSVAEVEVRASWLVSAKPLPELLPSVSALLQERYEAARASVLADLQRLEHELDQEFAVRAVGVPAYLEHPSLLPAAAVFDRVLAEARATLVNSPVRFLVRVNGLANVLGREHLGLEHFTLERTRLHGNVHLLTSAQRAMIRCHDSLSVRGMIDAEVGVLEEDSVLEAAAVLAAGPPSMELSLALTVARSL